MDEGYQITIYPEVISSESGDDKTFYQTIKGAYILCRCVTGAEESTAAAGQNTASESMPPALDNTADVVSYSIRSKSAYYLSGYGYWDYVGYDVHGNEIRIYTYDSTSDNRCVSIYILEYDEIGNVTKKMKCFPDGPDGTIYSYTYYTYEYDADGTVLGEWTVA